MFRRWFFAHSHSWQETGQSLPGDGCLLHRRITIGVALLIGAAPPCNGSSAVRGTEATFESPGGLTERCIAIDRVPGGFEREIDRAALPCSMATRFGTLVPDDLAGPSLVFRGMIPLPDAIASTLPP
jgi:hypothetical protein